MALDRIMSWQGFSSTNGLVADEDKNQATKRTIADAKASFKMNNDELLTRSISAKAGL